MDLFRMLLDSLLSGLFAGALGVLLTAPPSSIVPAVLCGFAGRAVRELLLSLSLGLGWASVAAGAAVVLIAAGLTRRHFVSPVILIGAILPLGPSTAVFNAILDLLRIPTLEGEAVREASISLIANASRAFTISLALALGLAVGITIVRFVRGERLWGGA
jgi:uncharacterized membrane protein YjjB (DUF3815 family)